MTISTSSDISQVVPTILAALPFVSTTFQPKLVAAIQCPSVVDTVAQAFEVFYTALHEDTALASAGAQRDAVATACKQVGYYLTYYGWHGKGQRAADVGVVCEQLLSGTALSALPDAPGVDPDYTTVVIPIQVAPHQGQ